MYSIFFWWRAAMRVEHVLSQSERGHQMKPVSAVRNARVLLVTPQPFFEERGTPIAVAHTLRALGELGYEVDLLAFPMGRKIDLPGVRIMRCGNPLRVRRVRVGFSAGKLALDVSLFQSFARLLHERKYDVVHAVEEAAWLAAVLCPLNKVPFIYDMASSIPDELSAHRMLGRAPFLPLLRRTERRVARRAAHVLCSGGLGSHVAALAPATPVQEWRFPVLEEQVPPHVAAGLRQRHGIGEHDRVVLYTGNFSRYQGIDLLLEAFATALERDPRLLLVCVGASDESQARHYSAMLPQHARDRARILVRESRSTMASWFAAADCLVTLRTSGRNVPLKVFEYMASRRPIVASRGPAHEPALDATRAILCDPDRAGVSMALQQVFSDPQRSQALARAAGAHAARHFSWPRFRSLVEGVYGRVLHAESAFAGYPAATR